jgi:lipopolysaccharide export system protein LptA
VSKYVLTLLLLLIAGTTMCQKKSRVNLISSTKSEGVKLNGVDVIKVYDGIWLQDGSRMRSDSAYFYQAQNAFDAFGHVNINQGDTLNIYSDKLNYNGNTKTAILTDNVKMVDKGATLTTNFFTYNTGTRIGTYVNGGKLVDKTSTLTSTNGYYFAGTHDAYFRYHVVCNTSDALINTDTMRYNSQSKIDYFYGPTTIYGAKDKDTLLTDNGTYDTKVEQALFTKNNFYKQGTKSLKGDTLFYDRLKGFGRAVKHVTFTDNEQKVTIKGGLGTYFKKTDLCIVTRDPYVILVTDKDSTKTDSVEKPVSVAGKIVVTDNKKPGKQPNVKPPKITREQAKLLDTSSKSLTMPVIDSFSKNIPKHISVDSVKKSALSQSKKADKETQNKIKDATKILTKGKLDTNEIITAKPVAVEDTSKAKKDSLYMSADTIETQIMTKKELDTMRVMERLSHIIDTTKNGRKPIVYKKSPKELTLEAPKFPKDTSFLHRDYFGPPKPVKAKPKKADIIAKNKRKLKIDSTFLDRPIIMSDTARVRIIFAFHHAKIFKSDLQAVADSIFYSNSDSTIRCYTKPMLWTQGSQLSGDTINLLMKNKKLDKMDMFLNAFIVNIDKGDSAHFNQVGGVRLRGFFKNSKLSRVVIDQNVESNYFVRDSATRVVTDMYHSLSSRMRLLLKNSEITDIVYLTKDDHSYTPIAKVKEDEKILKGFIWKPKDRPVSKESILPSYNRKRDTTKKAVVKPPGDKKTDEGKKGKPTSVKGNAPAKDVPAATTAKDSTAAAPKILPGVKGKTDSVLKKAAGIKADSLLKGTPPGKVAKKDTTWKK